MADIKMLLVVLVALLSLVDAAPIKIGLRKGPLRPLGSLGPLNRYGLQSSNGDETDVPISNFMDAQVRALCEAPRVPEAVMSAAIHRQSSRAGYLLR